MEYATNVLLGTIWIIRMFVKNVKISIVKFVIVILHVNFVKMDCLLIKASALEFVQKNRSNIMEFVKIVQKIANFVKFLRFWMRIMSAKILIFVLNVKKISHKEMMESVN